MSQSSKTSSDDPGGAAVPRRRRLIEALLVTAPIALLFVYLSPVRSLSDAAGRPPAMISHMGGIQRDLIDVGPGYDQAFGDTVRVCRYHGTEWDVTVQSIQMSTAEAIDKALASPQLRLVPLTLASADTAPESEIKDDPFKSVVQLGQLMVGPTRQYGEPRTVLAGESPTGRPLAILVSFPAGEGRTVLLTMKLREPTQLLNLLTPPDTTAMRAMLERVIPVFPASSLLDMIENESPNLVLTNFMLTQSTPEWEAAQFYEREIEGIETFAQAERSRIVFQTVRRGNATIYFAHYPGDTAGSSQTLVKVWRKIPSA